MRVVFFGTSAFAVPSLEQLAERGHELVMCVTQPDRPRGRGLVSAPSPVKEAALRLHVPLAQPERPQAKLFESLHPEIGVVAAYGQLIRKDLLELPPQGMLGVHPSLLPKYRGAAPVAWALLNGETTTGVTIFRLNERLDAGDMVVQQSVAIQPDEDTQALTVRLARLGAEALAAALEALARGSAWCEPQDESRASVAPKLSKAQGRIDWRAPAERIERLVRATIPWPGAFTEWRGGSLKILRARCGSSNASGTVPGAVIRISEDALTVAAGEGTVEVAEVQPAGRRRMSVKEFLAGHHVDVGDRFGAWGVGRGAGDGGGSETRP